MINTEKLCMGCMNEIDGEQVCPVCGYDSASQNPDYCLPKRFQINSRYTIGKMHSSNGEGITYIGWDNSEETIVWIKEYFPLGIAVRNPDTSVSMAVDKKYVFNEGLLEFIEINRKIMQQSLTSLQMVEDVFEYNGTAFVIYQNIPGINLEEFMVRNGGTVKWEQARALLLPIIDTIKAMNDIGIIHKGISPKSIIVGRDGKLRIMDYAIARLRVADADIENQFYDGFAAAEQYGGIDMQVGEYTDVYGFCATLFRVLIGTTIPKATLRLEDQSLSIPARFAEELPRHVLAALANGLKVKPEERTKDIETLKNELVYGEISEQTFVTEPQNEIVSSSKTKKKKTKSKSGAKYAVISALATVLVFLVIGGVLAFTVFREDLFGKNPSQQEDSNSQTLSSAPQVDAIGSVDSDAAESVVLYTVPNFAGKTYAQIMDEEENENFKIIIKNKIYSSKFPKGQICSQSVAKGEQVKKETKIEIVISLGPTEFKMPYVVGLDEQSAKLELLKAGFLYENIEVLEKYDEQNEPGRILEQSPIHGKKVNGEIIVKIYKNIYEGEAPMGYGDDDDILSDIITNTP